MSEAARRAALAVHARAENVQRQGARDVELATVRRMRPMQVELFEAAGTLELGQDFQLTDPLRWWDANFGIKVGDTLAVVELSNHSWVAFGHFSERDVAAGVRPLKPPASPGAGLSPTALASSSEPGLFTMGSVPAGGGTPTVTWNHHIVKKMEVYDAAGTRIGWVPVFSTLP